MNKDIIRIAEAIGFKFHGWVPGKMDPDSWEWPDGRKFSFGRTEDDPPFNPLTSHADCHALIEWLNGRHVDVEVRHKDTHSEVVMGWFDEDGRRVFDFWDSRSKKDKNDYRIGVVELTLKLLDASEDTRKEGCSHE